MHAPVVLLFRTPLVSAEPDVFIMISVPVLFD